MASPRKEMTVSEPRATSPLATRQASLEEALERLHLKTPGRHNSYSDSTDGDEEVEEAFGAGAAEHGRQMWERSVYHTPSSNLGLGRYDSTGNLDDTAHSAFYSPNMSMTRMDLSKRCRTNPAVAVVGDERPEKYLRKSSTLTAEPLLLTGALHRLRERTRRLPPIRWCPPRPAPAQIPSRLLCRCP